MCQGRCPNTCSCNNMCYMFVVILVRCFSVLFSSHNIYCNRLHTYLGDIIPMIVNDKSWRTFPVCVGECTLAATPQVPLATVPVRGTREGPPQAAQAGECDGQLNPAPSGQLLRKWLTLPRHHWIAIWNAPGCDNPSDSSWRNLVKLTLDCTVPMLNQDVHMSRG